MTDGLRNAPGVDELLFVAERCCREAAELLRHRCGKRLEVRPKGAFDQVTAADVEIEGFLREALRAAVPGSAVVGEELAALPGGSVTWYVDPIDGTSNFVRGLPIACISVGAAVDGRLVAGCVFDLFRDECFTGGKGMPLQVRSAGLRPVPGGGPLPMVLTDVPLPGSRKREEMDFLGDLLARADVRRVYSTALSLAWVAAGRADVACNLGIRPWDVAAGVALVRAAGGSYTPIDGGEAGGGDASVLRAPGFVAVARGAGQLGEWIAARLTNIHLNGGRCHP